MFTLQHLNTINTNSQQDMIEEPKAFLGKCILINSTLKLFTLQFITVFCCLWFFGVFFCVLIGKSIQRNLLIESCLIILIEDAFTLFTVDWMQIRIRFGLLWLFFFTVYLQNWLFLLRRRTNVLNKGYISPNPVHSKMLNFRRKPWAFISNSDSQWRNELTNHYK